MDHISNLANLSNNYALLIRKCFVHIHTSEENDVTNGAKEDDEEREEKRFGHWRLSGLVLSRCFFTPLGGLLVMRIFEDERYVVIKADKFTIF